MVKMVCIFEERTSPFKNSSKNKALKFSTTVSSSWIAAVEVEKTTSSGLELFLKDVIPLNPLEQSTNDTEVLLL